MVTKYVVCRVGDTTILCEEDPLNQLYSYGAAPPLPTAVRVTFSPAQTSPSSVTVILPFGIGFTITVTSSLSVLPTASVTVIEYVVVEFGDTTLEDPAPKPLLHSYVYPGVPPKALTVSVRDCPAHISASAPASNVSA